MLYQLTTTFACAGIITNDKNVVVETASIFKWTKGKNINEVVNFYKQKRKFVKLVKVNEK